MRLSSPDNNAQAEQGRRRIISTMQYSPRRQKTTHVAKKLSNLAQAKNQPDKNQLEAIAKNQNRNVKQQ